MKKPPKIEPFWAREIRAAVGLRRGGMKRASLDAGLNETFIRDMLTRGRLPSIENFGKICSVLGLNPLIAFKDETQILDFRVRPVVVKSYVQAGHWAESLQWPEDEWVEVYIPELPEYKDRRLYAAQTRGPSMNRVYAEGTYLIFNDIWQTEEELVPGKRYVVERIRVDGYREFTVKTLHKDDQGRFWLIPESTDPLFQSPIPVEGSEGEEVRVLGRVVFSIRPE